MSKSPPTFAAAIGVLLVVPGFYAVLGAYDAIFSPPPNLSAVPGSAHIAMFWRLSVAGYAAGMLAPVIYFAARARLRQTVDVLSVLALVVAGIVVVQGLALP